MLKYLIAFFMSMIPVLELRGAIPFALGMGIPYIPALLICTIGNLIPVPFVYVFGRSFLRWGSHQKYIGRLCTKFLEKGEAVGRKMVNATGKGGTFVALMLFVGIPLPGTGAWTGTLAASLLHLGVKTTALAVSLGILMAGLIMAIASGSVFHIVGL